MKQEPSNATLNRAKPYQLVLFPLNNGATNVYYVLILTYIATFGNVVLGLAMVFASFMVTGMRVFDAITEHMMWLRYAAFVVLYAVWVIGYTFQTSVTRAAQAVLTDDPKQRPLFTIFNTVGSLAGMGVMQFIGPILARDNIFGDYNQTWFAVLTPIGIIVSVVLTALAIIGIWEKDQPKYFGLGGAKTEKVKLSQYLSIIKANKPLQRLMIAGGGCKLALSIATNLTVLAMLYSCMMGNYDVLYLPMMVLGYVFAVPFFLLTVRTSQKHGQRTSLMRYVGVALACYVVVLILLILWNPGNAAFQLSLYSTEGGFHLTLNLYTILFIIFFGVGYGAYYATADMPIPMVADCSDYETYRTGSFVPGIMGTLFSLVDKLVSSLSATVVGVACSFIGLDKLPTKATPYVEGMNIVVIVLFCVIPMVAWTATLLSMKGYSLTGERMKEIRAVNAARKAAVADGMSVEEAMATWVTIDQVPEQFRT